MSEDVNEVLEVKSESEPKESAQQITSVSEETKYPALRSISGIYKALAIIIGIGAFIALVYGLSQLEGGYRARATGTTLIISSLISGIIGVIAFLSISEIIKLFIDLEDNSRKQITLLNKILDKK